MNENHPPKVSVLMLTYNHEPYIDDAICGVIRQKCPFPYELVIADDHSTDGTEARCRAWAARYPGLIRYVRNAANKGMARNFMDAYATLRGEYVAICEGDDWWCSKHKLRRQVRWLDAHPDYALCFHRVINYYSDTGVKSLSNGGKFGKRDVTLPDLAAHCSITNVSALWRRGLFGPLPGWFAQVPTYDYAMHLLNLQYGKARYMRRPMAVYRQHAGAIWSTAGIGKSTRIACGIRLLLIAYFAGGGNHEACDRLLATCLNGLARLERLEAAEAPSGESAAAAPGKGQGLPEGTQAEIAKSLGTLARLPYPGKEEVYRRHAEAQRSTAAQAGRAPGWAQRVRRALSSLRAALSRCVPLPRPRL